MIDGKQEQRLDIHIQRDVSFKSPIDGSVVQSHRALREHNDRNGVVDSREFSQAWYDQKAKERADFYQGTTHTIHGANQKRERRRDIAETIRRMENERS